MLKLIDIQSMLARSYNYGKWDLIETKELEHKHLSSLGFHQNYRDLLQKFYQQKINTISAVYFANSDISFFEIIQQLNLISHREIKENLTITFKTNILA